MNTHNRKRSRRTFVSLGACALLAAVTACEPPKVYTLHDLTQIDEHDRGKYHQLGSPNMGPEWFYTGTKDGQHVIVMRPVDKTQDRVFKIDENELIIVEPIEQTDDRTKWRRINHRIRAHLR